MNSPNRRKQHSDLFIPILLSCLFLCAYYFYFFYFIEPVLTYEVQESAFLLDGRFFNSFLMYPGGLSDYFSSFFMQFYYHSWSGALVITLIALILSVLAYAVIRSAYEQIKVLTIHLFPALLLLALYSDYKQPLSNIIAVIISLSSYLLYIKLASKNLLLRLVIFLLFSFAVYFCSGGLVFIFAVLCGLYEWLVRGAKIPAALYVPLVFLWPWICFHYLFLIDFKEAFLAMLTMKESTGATVLLLSLSLFYPLLLFASNWWYKHQLQIRKMDLWGLKRYQLLIRIILLYLIGSCTAALTFDSNSKNLLKVDYFARHHEWAKVLDTASRTKSHPFAVVYQANHALYHTGRLPYEMFSIPQSFGKDGLLMPMNYGLSAPMQNSDIYLELGHVNEAQHWAHEMLTWKGCVPSVLMRLALINLVKGENNAARKFLLILKKCVIQNERADYYLGLLDNPQQLNADSDIQSMRATMNDTDLPFSGDPTPRILTVLLENNKHNKMAFEYLMAYYLLNGQIENSMQLLTRLNDYNYPDIPRIYEEAIVFYKITMSKDFVLQDHDVSVQTLNRFKDFHRILLSYQRDKNAAKRELFQKYGNTYWYYILYSERKNSGKQSH
jgi:hypothetical protein